MLSISETGGYFMADLIVKTTYGYVNGVEENGYIVYKGIPFAKPPVGELRYKPPVNPDPYVLVLLLEKWRCIQVSN